ncbi:MAG TPA: NfeD family protein [Pirellulaceae bacterium]|nr:NfeD family protein [Pirellulaceae bacterium]
MRRVVRHLDIRADVAGLDLARRHPARTVRRLAWLALAGWLLGHFLAPSKPAAELLAQDAAEKAKADGAAGEAVAYRFDVPLPITGKGVSRRVEQALRKLPKGAQRPLFIFEFRPASGTAGEGSGFGDALDLARFLSGDQLSGVRTVAWVPRTIKGHAVLPVLACEQIIMGKQAELGAAGLNEKTIDPTVRRAYSEIAERRRTVPTAIALGLLDKDLSVFKVTTLEGVRYETAEELAKLRQQGAVSKEETVFQAGDQHLLTGNDMRFAFGFASHLAEDRRSLATALQLPLAALQQDLTPEEGWKPIHLTLSGPIHQQAVNWIVRSIDDHQRRGDFNLLVLSIDSGGGDLGESQRLAADLANLDQSIHTVAFVERQARGDAALIALACDELIVHPNATIGGAGEISPDSRELAAARGGIAETFSRVGRDWSLPAALVDPGLRVHKYTHPLGGEPRYLCAEEAQSLPDAAQWQREERALDTSDGLSGDKLEELGLARGTARNFEEFKAQFQLEGEIQEVRPNWALAAIEWLSDPRIAWILLFVGWFALMFELSTPGVGMPGFVAVVCFLLYFWSQFLHGTAGMLEILLFVGGLICLSVEIFVMPGTGVFGVGGGLMVAVSIILASQTFVVPTNAYQMRQFPVSLLMVAAGMAGGVASIYVIRRFLPDTPYLNRMLLAPPRAEEREAISRRESLVAWDHLSGKRGITMTPLVPAGKVQFGDELVDCVSNGELVAKGTPVVVEEVAGNRVVVRRVT